MDTKKLIFREACEIDLPAIIELLGDINMTQPPAVVLGRERFSLTPFARYADAFRQIRSSSNNSLILGVIDEEIVALCQITYIPNLTLGATKRATFEGVRVSSSFRGQGIGQKLMRYCLDQARQRGCGLVQLTTNVWRKDAIDFYLRLGFTATHTGMRIDL